MTLLLTDVTKFGIVFAADRQLVGHRQRTEKAQKVFPLERLNAAIAYFGQAYVGSKRMDRWLDRFIDEHCEIYSLEQLAHVLGTALEKGLVGKQRSQFLGFHLAGYVKQDGLTCPTFWFVRNFEHLDTTTFKYHGILAHFRVSEEILGHHLEDLTPRQLNALLAQGDILCFCNGTLEPYVGPTKGLQPSSLTEYTDDVLTRMTLTIQRCRQSSAKPPPIEGGPDIITVPVPSGAEPKRGTERIIRPQVTSSSATIHTIHTPP